MIKVIQIIEELAGNLAYKREIVQRLIAKMEKQLNDGNVEEVLAVSLHETDHDIHALAVIKIKKSK